MPTEFIGILLPADIEKRGPLAVWLAGCSLAYFARRAATHSNFSCVHNEMASGCVIISPAVLSFYTAERAPAHTWASGILIVALNGRQVFAIGNVWTVWGLRILGVILKYIVDRTRLIKIRVEFVWRRRY
jgi:hypothetical protein